MTHTEKNIEVNVPVRTAYNQWTQFESFPGFMKGVKSVKQLSDKSLHWVAEIGGKDVEWTAEITHQDPDRHIGWRSTSGAPNAGSVKFESLGADKTRVTVRIDYTPEGALEKTGSALGVVSHRIEAGRTSEAFAAAMAMSLSQNLPLRPSSYSSAMTTSSARR